MLRKIRMMMKLVIAVCSKMLSKNYPLIHMVKKWEIKKANKAWEVSRPKMSKTRDKLIWNRRWQSRVLGHYNLWRAWPTMAPQIMTLVNTAEKMTASTRKMARTKIKMTCKNIWIRSKVTRRRATWMPKGTWNQTYIKQTKPFRKGRKITTRCLRKVQIQNS